MAWAPLKQNRGLVRGVNKAGLLANPEQEIVRSDENGGKERGAPLGCLKTLLPSPKAPHGIVWSRR